MKPASDAATSILNHRMRHFLPMRSFKVILPEANRPGPRLQPKRRGAASIQEDSECIPSDPGVGVAKINPFSFAGRGCKQGVHIFVFRLKFSRHHKAPLSVEFNGVRHDGRSHIFSGPAFVP